jgi:hypothetical protein
LNIKLLIQHGRQALAHRMQVRIQAADELQENQQDHRCHDCAQN